MGNLAQQYLLNDYRPHKNYELNKGRLNCICLSLRLNVGINMGGGYTWQWYALFKIGIRKSNIMYFLNHSHYSNKIDNIYITFIELELRIKHKRISAVLSL